MLKSVFSRMKWILGFGLRPEVKGAKKLLKKLDKMGPEESYRIATETYIKLKSLPYDEIVSDENLASLIIEYGIRRSMLAMKLNRFDDTVSAIKDTMDLIYRIAKSLVGDVEAEERVAAIDEVWLLRAAEIMALALQGRYNDAIKVHKEYCGGDIEFPISYVALNSFNNVIQKILLYRLLRLSIILAGSKTISHETLDKVLRLIMDQNLFEASKYALESIIEKVGLGKIKEDYKLYSYDPAVAERDVLMIRNMVEYVRKKAETA